MQKVSGSVALLFFTVSAFYLTSCSPVYQDFHTYTAPPTAEGKNCTLQCDALRLECERDADRSYQDCADRAQWAYKNCLQSQKFGEDPTSKKQVCIANCSCSVNSCSRVSSYCSVRYHECFSRCGGTVQTETRCVQRCG
jgi:hypothetical protein